MAVYVCGCGGAGSILMGREWQGCCYLSGGRAGAGNGEEYFTMGGDSGRMGAAQKDALRVHADHRGWHFYPNSVFLMSHKCCAVLF